jgi:hypothetical protein
MAQQLKAFKAIKVLLIEKVFDHKNCALNRNLKINKFENVSALMGNRELEYIE